MSDVLAELHVKDLALVEDVWLEFGDGLTVLTGETGAGKTVLVGALKLLLGDRADTTLVRSGADEALVEGRFVIDGQERLVRRRMGADGRSRCTIDGEMATVTALGELLSGVVDLHGQHEHQALLSVARHAGYLDRYAGAAAVEAKAAYRASLRTVADARAALEALEGSLADRDRRVDYLRFQISDIDSVSPKPGEDVELEALLPRLRHADKLTGAAAGAWAALRDDEAASDYVARAVSALHAVAGLDDILDGMSGELEALSLQLDELGSRLREYAESVEHDPHALDAAETRLAALTTLKRKYGTSLDDVIAVRSSAALELETLDAGEAGLEAARARTAAAEATLRRDAEHLSEVRRNAIPDFASELAAAANDLALPGAVFDVSVTKIPFASWTGEGPERIEFLFSSGAGEAPRPLAKIASGGEISRVMLALKDVLGGADKTPVLVFDEVDAGIGGATALAVGRRLASLAKSHQVLVVTHLAQVAAYADRQVVVSKESRNGRSVTGAVAVEAEERVLEIARMLSGGTSQAGVEHARELLESVRA
ncbi:MAG: DNA repair protein RecN [Coriobacteriia bacterium]